MNAVGPGPIFAPFHQRRLAASGETVELFLASDDASYVTGALLFVDGGMTAM